MEEINPKQEQAYVSFSGEMKCGKCRSTTFWEHATHTSLENERERENDVNWYIKLLHVF